MSYTRKVALLAFLAFRVGHTLTDIAYEVWDWMRR